MSGYGPSRERKTEKLEDGPYLSLVKRIDAGVISNLTLNPLFSTRFYFCLVRDVEAELCHWSCHSGVWLAERSSSGFGCCLLHTISCRFNSVQFNIQVTDGLTSFDGPRLRKSFCDELATFPLQFHPGDRWEYSMGLDVLGRV